MTSNRFLFFTLITLSIILFSGCDGCSKKRELTLNRPDSLIEMRAEETRRKYQEAMKEANEAAKAKPRPASPKVTKPPKQAEPTEPEPEMQQVQTIYVEPGIDYSAMDNTISVIEDKVQTTVESAKRRLNNKTGYIQYQIFVAPTGQVKSVSILHNDLDAAAGAAIQAIVRSTSFKKWNPAANSENEYKSPLLKSVF
ncbi:MAG: hypothetical protein SFU91_07410 [Chloroherpetonaceae bacterium]|nr:hypothetical protein [Chloroherpetonaceae bacterium]